MMEKLVRCAIYTRKSSEEGLEQSFNSLHAQREACEAYILSQKHEGWQLLPEQYDDGGFSGGTMDRPGLKKLLADIAVGKIDTVVVYKVDRLTRTLSDFARIVETFDSKSVSFVSVTQQFNTTSSMGRLTLNVLLSFAQFEREVTGERIRDKVAASKKKGMWMGGNIPLGYDLKDRALVVNASEAETVRLIFKKYLELGSVFDLHESLTQNGIRSKKRTCLSGRQVGGRIISRGTLYNMLSNPLYVGKVRHGTKLYDGQHEALIDDDIWKSTAELLKCNGVKRITSRNLPSERPLMGILVQEDGTRYTPSHASKKGRRYDYYVSPTPHELRRLPAIEIESAVAATLRSFLSDGQALSRHLKASSISELRLLVSAAQHRAQMLANGPQQTPKLLRKMLKRVVVKASSLTVQIDATELYSELNGKHEEKSEATNAVIELECPFVIKKRGNEVRLTLAGAASADPKPVASLSRAVARAHDWSQRIVAGEACTMRELIKYSGLTKQYVRQIFRCALLSPQNTSAILDGIHPVDLTVAGLTRKIEVDWIEQKLA